MSCCNRLKSVKKKVEKEGERKGDISQIYGISSEWEIEEEGVWVLKKIMEMSGNGLIAWHF